MGSLQDFGAIIGMGIYKFARSLVNHAHKACGVGILSGLVFGIYGGAKPAKQTDSNSAIYNGAAQFVSVHRDGYIDIHNAVHNNLTPEAGVGRPVVATVLYAGEAITDIATLGLSVPYMAGGTIAAGFVGGPIGNFFREPSRPIGNKPGAGRNLVP